MRIAFVFLLLGCGSGEPYCAGVDSTGRPLIFCASMQQAPVCDAPGESAQFQEREGEIVLIDGDDARCDEEGETVCPAGTTGEPYCLTVPNL
jgi:hypothetical protein